MKSWEILNYSGQSVVNGLCFFQELRLKETWDNYKRSQCVTNNDITGMCRGSRKQATYDQALQQWIKHCKSESSIATENQALQEWIKHPKSESSIATVNQAYCNSESSIATENQALQEWFKHCNSESSIGLSS